MKWHEEVLDADALSAATRLAPVLGGRFYLAGGTGLALRYGHRISLDLDLFSREDKLDANGRQTLLSDLKTSGKAEVLECSDRTLHLRVGRTPVSLFHYPYALCGPTTEWRGIPVASDVDIGAMKINAIAGRGARKDFLDLYWICRKTGLERILDAVETKFPDHADFLVSASKALVYFEDAEQEPEPRLLRPLSWRKIKAYFESETPKVLRKRLR